MVVFGAHQTQPPRLLQDATEGGQHLVRGSCRISLSEGSSDRLAVLVSQLLPRKRTDVSTASRGKNGDHPAGLTHGPAGTRAEAGQVDGGRVTFGGQGFDTEQGAGFDGDRDRRGSSVGHGYLLSC